MHVSACISGMKLSQVALARSGSTRAEFLFITDEQSLTRIYEILSNSSFSYALHRKYRKIRIGFIEMAF
jgi:hypothetical protein